MALFLVLIHVPLPKVKNSLLMRSQIVWVCNGFFVLIPLIHPSAAFSGESSWGGGVSAVVGATIFELGSIFLMIEAVNENRSECFGWAIEHALDKSGEDLLLRKQDSIDCQHHHSEKGTFVSGNTDRPAEDGKENGEEKQAKDRRTWTWWPSSYELRTHYFRDIGFLACLSQFFGATIFWISGFTGIPQILNVLTVPAENGIYWLPQVISSTCTLAGALDKGRGLSLAKYSTVLANRQSSHRSLVVLAS